jgi:CRISPR-associated protein Csx10
VNALTFTVRLLQPLLVTEPGAGEENASRAFDFIPGGALRGEVLNRYLRQNKVADAAADPACRKLFFDGSVRYLNAYPLNRLGTRTLPRPLSWRIPKDSRGDPNATVYDLAAADKNWDDLPGLSAPREPFCWRDQGFAELDEPARYLGFHSSSATRNVKGKGKSTVYRYEAIAAGQDFGAVILSNDGSLLRSLVPLVDGIETAMGGSRSAGYGAVHFEDVAIVSDWHEYENDEVPDDDVAIVTLVSDAVLRDHAGQPTTDLDRVLGWRHVKAFHRTRLIGGFNQKWGLPLVQVPALQAGSVVVYRAGEADRQVLLQAQEEGIGERRLEGFGRVAINWHTRPTLQRRVVPRTPSVATLALTLESRALAQQMADRMLRAALDQKLLRALDDLRISTPPSNAQLSHFRVALRRASQDADAKRILDHLARLNKRSKQQFEQARIYGKRLSDWLHEGIEQGRIWDEWLNPTALPSIAGVTAQPTDRLKLEYTVRLLDALFKRAAKPDRPGGIR